MTDNGLLLFALTILLLVGCKDKDKEDPIPEFTGITETDINGVNSGTVDATDWRMNDVWEEREKALFDATTVSSCAPIADLQISPAFPNATPDRFTVNIQNLNLTTWQFRLVDKDFNVLFTYHNGGFIAGLNPIVIQTIDYPKDTLRLYYQAERNGCLWRGHGDILVKP